MNTKDLEAEPDPNVESLREEAEEVEFEEVDLEEYAKRVDVTP